jgi:hypothetical protein
LERKELFLRDQKPTRCKYITVGRGGRGKCLVYRDDVTVPYSIGMLSLNDSKSAFQFKIQKGALKHH